MDMVTIGRTGITASRLGFGAMRLPQKDDGIDMELGQQMVDRAIMAGVNYFDTGYGYHGGKSEGFLGETLKNYSRDSYIMTSKLSLLSLTRSGTPTREFAEKMFDEQLERLRIDYFDFYLIHNISSDERRKLIHDCGLIDLLLERKRRGQIRHIGFSYHDKAESIGKTLDLADWDMVQVQLNYFDWEYQNAKHVCEEVAKRGAAIVAMEPVRGGGLINLPPTAEEALREANPDETNAAWALRWVANETASTVILSGMSNMEQLEQNIETFAPLKPFSADERAAVNKAARVMLDAPIVACTGCEYCLPCPLEIKIPKYFGVYNDFIRFQNAASFKSRYEKLTKDAPACTACGKCVADCPQGIDIPKELGRMAKV